MENHPVMLQSPPTSMEYHGSKMAIFSTAMLDQRVTLVTLLPCFAEPTHKPVTKVENQYISILCYPVSASK